MDPVLNSNRIMLPIGTSFSILKATRSGLKDEVKIINGNQKGVFFGVFNEDDVDFEIQVDNRNCPRGVNYVLMINNKQYSFYIEPRKTSTMKALETNGKKFHFKSQKTEEGQYLVAATADKHGMSFQETEIICSRLNFSTKVEVLKEGMKRVSTDGSEMKGAIICVCIQTLAGKSVDVFIGTQNTIYDLKKRFAEREGTTIDHQLIFAGKQRENWEIIADCGITSSSVLYVIYNVGSAKPFNFADSYNSATQANVTPVPPPPRPVFNFGINHLAESSPPPPPPSPPQPPTSSFDSFRNFGLPPVQTQQQCFPTKPFYAAASTAASSGTSFSGTSAEPPFSGGTKSTSTAAISDCNSLARPFSGTSSFGSSSSGTLFSTSTPFAPQSQSACFNFVPQSQTQSFGGSLIAKREEKTMSGERGVICFGNQSDQKYSSYFGFVQDYNLIINPFTIELRMGSKYEPI